jgi:hypothetical protein
VKFRLSIIAAVLCLSIMIPSVCLGAGQESVTPEPAWLHRMLQDGWQRVQQGVLQRDMGGGRVETFTYGQEGLRWTTQKLQERISSLQGEHAQHPSAELARVIASLERESTQTDSSLRTAQADAFAGEAVTAGCEPTFGVHAAADPLTGSQGVTASADASYNSPCGDLGNVYSYAYARATSGTTTAVKIEEDPKFDGTSLASAVAVSVNGSLDCYSEAYARAWSPALDISYETSDTNFSCPGATSPGPTPSSPSGWTDDGAVVRLTNVSDKVGIGTTTPAASLHVATESTSQPRGVVIQESVSANNSAFLVFRKSRGTIAAPSVIANGDVLGTLYGEGYDGTEFMRAGANIKFTAVGPVSTGSIPTDLVFSTGSSGLGQERMRISSDGFMTVGVPGDTGPKLAVNGNVIVSNNVGIGTTTPVASLHVATESTAQPRGVVIQQSVSSNNSAFLIFRKSRGTIATPAVVATGDALGTIYGEGYDGTAFTRAGANIKFSVAGPVSAGSVPTDLVFSTGPSGSSGMMRMRIASDGLVTVGSAGETGPKLTVNGDVTITGTINGRYQDVAEWVPAREPISAGMVVVLDPSASNQVTASSAAYATTVAGVVSDQPGLILGQAGDAKVKVATTGRVRVKVDATKHPIAIGDLLVSSDVPGVAMVSEPVDIGGVKLHRPGTLIGKALEPLTGGEGEILVLLSLQ